jgi:hypothetical protein
MAWFKKDELKDIQKQISQINAQTELERAKSQLATLKDSSIYVQSSGKESIIDTLYGIPSLRALTGYTSLVQIPFMVRESMPYKQVIVRTIVQLDFIRFIGRLLYEECPTFSTALECMRAKIFGPKGLKMQAYSLQEGENEERVKQLNYAIKELDDYNCFKEWQKECFIRYHKDGECFLQIKPATRSINDNPPELRMIEPDFIRPSVKQGQGHEDPHISGGTGEDWSFGIHCKAYSWYKPDKYQIVYPPEWDMEEQVAATDMFHAAYREHRNMKRGIPTCFKLVDDLVRVTVLREALSTGAISRARIAGVVKYETNIDNSYVKTDLSKLANPKDGQAFQVNPTTTWHDDDDQAHFLGLLPGRDFVDYPSFDAQSAEIIYKMGLSTIASYYHLPLSAFGLAEEHSYAASEVEESTPDTAREEDQGFWTSYWERVVKRLLELHVGEIDWTQIGIEAKGPSMVVRDQLKETQNHVARVDAKFESRATAQAALGLDPKDEDDKIENDPVQQEMDEQKELENQAMLNSSEPKETT